MRRLSSLPLDVFFIKALWWLFFAIFVIGFVGVASGCAT